MKVKRPLSVTWLALGVLSFTVVHITRLVLTMSQWDQLNQTLPETIPSYLVLSGLVWSLIGLPLTLGLWWGKPWGVRGTYIVSLAYVVYYWSGRIFLTRDTLIQTNQPFAIGATLFVIAAIIWTLSRPRARAFFGAINDGKSENKKPA